MKFPIGSHVPDEQEVLQNNAEALQQHMSRIDWRFWFKFGVAVWAVFLFAVLTFLVTVRFALTIF